MTNFSKARTIGDIVGAFLVLALVLFSLVLAGIIVYALYDEYQDFCTVKVVRQGDKTYTGLVISDNGLVTVISGQQKTILNSLNGKIEIEKKDQ